MTFISTLAPCYRCRMRGHQMLWTHLRSLKAGAFLEGFREGMIAATARRCCKHARHVSIYSGTKLPAPVREAVYLVLNTTPTSTL